MCACVCVREGEEREAAADSWQCSWRRCVQLGVGGGGKGVRIRSGDSGRALFNLSPMIEVGSGGISACTHEHKHAHTLRSAMGAGPDGARVMEAADCSHS